MAEIEIVIRISEDSYKATCSGSMLPPDVKNVVNAIKNGAPLPKGHGYFIVPENENNGDVIEEITGRKPFNDSSGSPHKKKKKKWWNAPYKTKSKE